MQAHIQTSTLSVSPALLLITFRVQHSQSATVHHVMELQGLFSLSMNPSEIGKHEVHVNTI